jgi:hypothetical protein
VGSTDDYYCDYCCSSAEEWLAAARSADQAVQMPSQTSLEAQLQSAKDFRDAACSMSDNSAIPEALEAALHSPRMGVHDAPPIAPAEPAPAPAREEGLPAWPASAEWRDWEEHLAC